MNLFELIYQSEIHYLFIYLFTYLLLKKKIW